MKKNACARECTWPQKSTSTTGENHRIKNGIDATVSNAVSDRLFSKAMDCMVAASRFSVTVTTAAGLRWKSSSANAST